jgi:hypothetical protein
LLVDLINHSFIFISFPVYLFLVVLEFEFRALVNAGLWITTNMLSRCSTSQAMFPAPKVISLFLFLVWVGF